MRVDSALIDVKPERLRKLLEDLVDIYSPSGKEQEILKYVDEYLRGFHLMPVRQEVDENRYNLLVLPEKVERIKVCFIGHLDTITAHDLDNYGYREKGTEAFGLGTADMKAGCAAMMEAFTVLAEAGINPPVALALVIDEEEDNKGAKMLAREHNFPWAIIGEPTNLSPCLGHYGYLEILVRTQGKKAHSAMPEMGNNAIEAMLRLLLRITEYITSGSQGLVYNIRELTGFPSGFVVPDICEAWLDLHVPPHSPIDVLKTELVDLADESRKVNPDLDACLSFEDTYTGYQVSSDERLVKVLRKTYRQLALPWEPQDFRSHSDGNILWTAGIQPVILGPGRLEAAHTPEESVSFPQVVQAAQLYLNFALHI